MFNRQSLHVAMLVWGFVFNLIAALCMFMSKNFDKEKRRRMICMQLCCAVLLLNDAMAWGFRGRSGMPAYYMVRISNFIVFLLSDLLLYLYHGYMCCYLFGEKAKLCTYKRKQQEKERIRRGRSLEDILPIKRICAVYLLAVLGMVLVIISQFTNLYYYIDADNLYHRNNPPYILSLVIPMCGMLLDFSILLDNRKRIGRDIFVSMMSYIILPFAAAVMLVFYYGISLNSIAIGISMILMFVVTMIEQNKNISRKEEEMADMRISMMLSQIAPHFIYNVLTTIQGLCESNPKQAGEVTGQFSQYLRGNLNSLSEKKTIPFEQELSHVQCYLAIEQRRFGDRVKVKYDIQCKDFFLPALTIQPVVENAVKHGLCKKLGGGTVAIETRREAQAVVITVRDDGVGFEEEKQKKNDNVHVGLQNVKSRIEKMCKGTVEISSKAGVGTAVTIIIPQTDAIRRE